MRHRPGVFVLGVVAAFLFACGALPTPAPPPAPTPPPPVRPIEAPVEVAQVDEDPPVELPAAVNLPAEAVPAGPTILTCCRDAGSTAVVTSYLLLVGRLHDADAGSTKPSAAAYRLLGDLVTLQKGGVSGEDRAIVDRLVRDVGAVKNGDPERIRARLTEITDGVAALAARRAGGRTQIAEAWCTADGRTWLQAPTTLESPYTPGDCASWR
jgi:hypothetical protein